MSITLEYLASPTDDACQLICELEAELSVSFPAEQRHGLSVAAVFQPHILFFLARVDGRPVGCGGIAFENGLAELKRMYVRTSERKQGIAQCLLVRLEAEAKTRGFSRIVLETGDVLAPAIRFYEQAGFVRCEAFGAYAAMSPQAIERSLFFEKRID